MKDVLWTPWPVKIFQDNDSLTECVCWGQFALVLIYNETSVPNWRMTSYQILLVQSAAAFCSLWWCWVIFCLNVIIIDACSAISYSWSCIENFVDIEIFFLSSFVFKKTSLSTLFLKGCLINKRHRIKWNHNLLETLLLHYLFLSGV